MTLTISPPLIQQLQPKYLDSRALYKGREANKVYSWLDFVFGAILVELPYSLVARTIYFFCWWWLDRAWRYQFIIRLSMALVDAVLALLCWVWDGHCVFLAKCITREYPGADFFSFRCFILWGYCPFSCIASVSECKPWGSSGRFFLPCKERHGLTYWIERIGSKPVMMH